MAFSITNIANKFLNIRKETLIQEIFSEAITTNTERVVDLSMIGDYSNFDFYFQNSLKDVNSADVAVAIGFYMNAGNANKVMLTDGTLAQYRKTFATLRQVYHKVPYTSTSTNRLYLSQIPLTYNFPVTDNVEVDIVAVDDKPWETYKKTGLVSGFNGLSIGLVPLAVPTSGSFKIVFEGRA